TVSWFLMIVLADRMAGGKDADWETFRRRNADLLTDARALLARHYSDECLASARARARFVLPGRAPSPAPPAASGRPAIPPPSFSRMPAAAGFRGSTGMVMIAPQMTTTNSAPAARRISRMGTTWPFGAPSRFGSVEKLYWVFAMQIG